MLGCLAGTADRDKLNRHASRSTEQLRQDSASTGAEFCRHLQHAATQIAVACTHPIEVAFRQVAVTGEAAAALICTQAQAEREMVCCSVEV